MESMGMRFVTGEPAAMLPGRMLVITDLHIGAEHSMRQAGLRMPSQTPALLERTLAMVRKAKARRLVILGDVKHRIPGLSMQERREVPAFLNRLADEPGLDSVEVVPGNHDGGLEGLAPDTVLHPSSGFMHGRFYLTHGHTWPSPDFLRAGHVLMGHNHPLIEFRDRLGYVWRERVWIRAELKKGPVEERYGKVAGLPEVVVMPTYNDVSGGRALNGRKWRGRRGRAKVGEGPRRDGHALMGPLGRAVKMSTAKAYMLDGTYLGRLSGL
jgi:hypothetical protein